VKERDTTFLVVELLASSSEFRTWFFNRIVANPAKAQFRGVMRSVETHGRETDIRIEFEIDGRRHLALVENKIDAAFGERQIPDYHERADRYVQEGRCDRAIVVLLAPTNRVDAETRERFDHSIMYEQIRDQLSEMSYDNAPFAEEIFRIALEQEGDTNKTDLMTALVEQLEPVLEDTPPQFKIEATDNRVRIRSGEPDFPSSIWYEIRAKFSAVGTVAPGVRVSTDDNAELRAIYNVLESQYGELPLDNYRTQLADDHRKKQGMLQWVLEVPGEPDAVSDDQIQQATNAMGTIIENYHESLRDVISV
jgi:hypothetical protein